MGTHVSLFLGRICEYDDQEIEYWVNTRTSGVLSREDMQQLRVSRLTKVWRRVPWGHNLMGSILKVMVVFLVRPVNCQKSCNLKGMPRSKKLSSIKYPMSHA